ETAPSQGETDPVSPSESGNVEPGTPATQPQSESGSESVKPTDPPVSSKVEPVTPGQYTGGPLDFDSDQDVLFDRANQLHAERAIYITFDDGPSYLTEGLLDVLDQYHVKATFFVVYKPEYEAVYRDIVSRGHALGVHCAVHDYDHLYANFETWQADFDKMYNYLRDTIGYTPRLYRFPGGSIRKLEWKDQLIAYLKSKNVVYWDWNVVTEDGDQNMPKEQIMENAVQGTQRILPVILSHDGDGQDVSVGCIPEVLQFYLDKGFTFRVLDDTVPPIQQGGGIHKWDYYK
ncbi:MAG: polysaccharide deacetylase family protein, partial [Lachnospiraceae bacterium]|nr:polysaccharide deacetylase family protein [Lachnospiraceae bacterium]